MCWFPVCGKTKAPSPAFTAGHGLPSLLPLCPPELLCEVLGSKTNAMGGCLQGLTGGGGLTNSQNARRCGERAVRGQPRDGNRDGSPPSQSEFPSKTMTSMNAPSAPSRSVNSGPSQRLGPVLRSCLTASRMFSSQGRVQAGTVTAGESGARGYWVCLCCHCHPKPLCVRMCRYSSSHSGPSHRPGQQADRKPRISTPGTGQKTVPLKASLPRAVTAAVPRQTTYPGIAKRNLVFLEPHSTSEETYLA